LIFLAHLPPTRKILPRIEIPVVRPEPIPEPVEGPVGGGGAVRGPAAEPRPIPPDPLPGQEPGNIPIVPLNPDTPEETLEEEGLSADDIHSIFDAVSSIVDAVSSLVDATSSSDDYTDATIYPVETQYIPATTTTWYEAPACTTGFDGLSSSCADGTSTYTSLVPKRTETFTVTEQLLRPKTMTGASYLTITTTAIGTNATRTFAVVVAHPTSTSFQIQPMSSKAHSGYTIERWSSVVMIGLIYGLAVLL